MIHSKWTEVAGHRLHVRCTGAACGAVPIVLLHGYGCSSEYLLPLIDALTRERFETFAPDLPGHGLTPKRSPIGSIGLENMVGPMKTPHK